MRSGGKNYDIRQCDSCGQAETCGSSTPPGGCGKRPGQTYGRWDFRRSPGCTVRKRWRKCRRMTFWCCLFRRVRTEQLSRHRSERRRSRWRRWRRTASPGRWCWAERAAAFFRGWNPGDWAGGRTISAGRNSAWRMPCRLRRAPSRSPWKRPPGTLHGTAALVIGYGRIGMALAPRLRGLGMDVTVCARRCETRALAEMQGFAAVPMEQLPGCGKGSPGDLQHRPGAGAG